MYQNELNTNERNEKAQDEMLAAILQKLGAVNSSTSPPPQNSTETLQTSSSAGGSTDILSSLLSNPELIAKLPTIIASIKPILELFGKSGLSAVESAPVAALPAKNEPSIAQTAKVERGGSDSRTALLCAMKPYLGADRQNAIDYIVKLGRLGEILKTL